MLRLLDCGPSERGWHFYERALRCPQLFAWSDTGGPLARADGPIATPLVRGSLGHVGLAHLYAFQQAAQRGETPDLYRPIEAMELASAEFGEVGEAMLPVAIRAVRAYVTHYAEENFKILAVEEPVETEFDGERYTARIDLVFEDDAGRVWIMDHKFVGRIEGKVLRRYVLSGQFLGLSWLGSRLYGERFAGIRLNLIDVRGPDFERLTPEPAPWMLVKFPSVVRYAGELIRMIRRLAEQGQPIPAAPSEMTCYTAYGECPAFELCRWGASAPRWTGNEDG